MTTIKEIRERLGVSKDKAWFLAKSGFSFDKPKMWRDHEFRPYYSSPKYKIGDKVFVYTTNSFVPHSRLQLKKLTFKNLDILLEAKVVGFYDIGYYIKILKVLYVKKSKSYLLNRQIGDIIAYHHAWIEDADLVAKAVRMNAWRIA